MHNQNLSDFILRLISSAAENSPKDHSRNMITLLRDVVHFDSAWWGWSSFSDSQVTIVNSETAHLPDSFERAFRQVARLDPFIHHGRDLQVYAMAIENKTAKLPPEFSKFLDTFDISATLNGHCKLQGKSDFNFFMSLYRLEEAPFFTQDQTRDFKIILRHLEQSLSLSLRAELRMTAPERGEAALLSKQCRMVRATRGFDDLLDKENLLEPDRAEILLQLSRNEGVWTGKHLRLTSSHYASSLMLIHASPSSVLDTLSPKERHVAELLASGLTMRQIAEKRQVAFNTVRNQVAAIYRKIGVSSQLGLVNIMNIES